MSVTGSSAAAGLGRTLRRRSTVAAAIVIVAIVGTILAIRLNPPEPVPQSLRLADGTEVFFLSDTRVQPATAYPQSREIHVDGDAFLRVPDHATPLIVRTRLLVLTVTGDSALRVTAWAKESGEQVEVLQGHVKASKSYPSNYSEPDLLTTGDMTMINQTIDLMEKETFDPAQLRTWSENLIAAARHQETLAAARK